MQDALLMDLLHRSPDDGLERLMDEYMGLVCSIVRNRLSGICPAEDIEECVSDCFAHFYRSMDSVDLLKGTVKAFLCAIAKHKATDVYLKNVKAPQQIPLDEITEQTANDFSVEEQLVTKETRQALTQAIVSLGQPDHEIIVRKFFFREPSKQIAQRLDMTVSAVDTRTHRALAKLREMLGGLDR